MGALLHARYGLGVGRLHKHRSPTGSRVKFSCWSFGLNFDYLKKAKKKKDKLTRPICSQRDSLKEAAVVMTWGKLVAPGKAPPNLTPGPTLETPWRASDHHSYPWMPSLGTAAALLTSNLIFSCNVNLPIKSLTLTCIGTLTRQNLRVLVKPLLGSQAKGARDSTA